MKKGINAWADYDQQGDWTLCIGKKRGKHIRAEKENRWMQRLEGRKNNETEI